ncbi:hypothetical protein BUALT_Bualt16G0088600 [Buddleja alternifolia]|uniref:Endonuclease/exonuclease/phosphatase domain-containing protein n=1 Tax=Buddleja alternifolia TaxID=168488 RepID=A0AAV6WIG0_9LAMI|nr:hypothetical protein BUALT_Bualt16G0088600 [Buddleja alternifolia]
MSVSLTIMTFNLLEDQPEDSPNSWDKRKDLCVTVITSYSPIIICTQQGVKSQLDYLQQCLPGYEQFGVSRKGSEDTSDQHCTIFYDKEKVELLEGGTFWLSESPSVPGSISWGSADPCISTWAISFSSFIWASYIELKGVDPPGFSFQIVNTNMDELSPRARRRGALLTWQHIASLPPNLPVLYCGGFNTQKESTTGRFLLGRSRWRLVMGIHVWGLAVVVAEGGGSRWEEFMERSRGLGKQWWGVLGLRCLGLIFMVAAVSREHGVVGDMRDAWPNARVRKNVSLIHTYHGFKGVKRGALEFLKLIFRALCLCWDRQTQDLHIDWILFRGRSLIPVSCEVVSDNVDGYYPSSHYPIFAEFMLPRSVRLTETPTQD